MVGDNCPRWQRCGVASLLASLVTIGLLVGCSDEPKEPVPTRTVSIQFLHGPEIRPYLARMRDLFYASSPTLADGSRIDVELVSELGVPAAMKVASGEIKADAWLAPSSALVNLANSRVQNLGAHQTDCQQLFSSPVVLAVPAAEQSRLSSGAQTFDWRKVFALISAGTGPDNRTVRFSHAPPKASVSGLAVMSQLLAFTANEPLKPLHQVTWSEQGKAGLKRFQQRVSEYSLSEGFLLERVAQSSPELVHISLSTEQQVVLFNRNSGQSTPAVIALYPEHSAVWQDYTMCGSEADWVAPDRQEATAIWRRFLTSDQAQAALPQEGFRPSISKRADPQLLGPKVGINLALPTGSAYAQQGEVITEILSNWEGLLRPVSLTIVIDTSSSMEGDTLTAVKDALRDFLARVPPHVSMSLVSFSNEPRMVTPFTSDRAQPISALDPLTAQGGGAAYDGIRFGLDTLRIPGREQERKMLLVITDGEGQISEMSRPALIATFKRRIREQDLVTVMLPIKKEGTPYDDLAEITKAADGRFKEVAIGELALQFEDILKSL
jgi:uncharacterized protein YegL